MKEKSVQKVQDFDDVLIDIEESRERSKDAWKKQKMISGIEAQTSVVNYKDEYWLAMLEWAKEKNLVSPEEQNLLSLAGSKAYQKIPNEFQAKTILQIQQKIVSEGYIEPQNN